MNEPIIYVGGSKGGVGKSKLSFAIIDYLIECGNKVILIETDTSNPDVFKAHQKYENLGTVCRQVNLDTSEGWIELVNLADEFSDHFAVINSAARSNIGMEKYGATLKETLGELNRELITFWIINRQRDSIELLRGFLNIFPNALVYVFRNLYFGESGKFELYNNSNAKKLIEEKGNTFDFPDLADRVADKIYSNRLPIQIALKELPIGDRAELKRWKSKCKEIFDDVFNKKSRNG